MTQTANMQLIADSVLGSDLSQAQCETLATIVKHQKLTKDEVLFEPNTKDGNLYLLISGKLDIFKVIGQEKVMHISALKSGSMIGELSFIDDVPHAMRLQARKESEVLYLSRDDFENLLADQPELVYNVMRSILRFSHKLQRKMLQENLDMQRIVQNEYMTQY